MATVPLYEESAYPSLPGLFMRTDQLDAVVKVRSWGTERGTPDSGFSGTAGTGVLIGPRLVLTAKHVAAELTRERASAVPATYLDVVFGADGLTQDPSLVLPVYASEVINPGIPLPVSALPRGLAAADLLPVNQSDLALLLLGRAAPAQPIPLAPADPTIGQYLQLSGYGQMAIGMAQRGWAIGTVTHFVDDRSGFFVRATGSMESDTSPGPGDSGGPAISVSPSGTPQVCGIVTGGKWLFPELARTRMEMYVSVAHHRDWIDEASTRLLGEDWQHEKTVGGTAEKPWYKRTSTYVVGGAVVLTVIGLVAVARSGK